MDETQQPEELAPVEAVPETAEDVQPPPLPPPLPQATAGGIVRDACLDLVGAVGSGAAVIFVGSLAAAVALGFNTAGTGSLLQFMESPWGVASLFFATQAPLLYFALRRRRRNREKQRPELAWFGGAPGAIGRGVTAGLALTVVSMLYTAALQRLLGEGAVEQQLDFLERALSNKPAVAALVFIIAVMAPFCEEIFFRGAIFGSARAAGLSTVGAATSAVLFSIVHLSLLLAPFYAAFALVMCRLYVRTGTLAAPIAAHMTLNGIACAALLIAGGTNRV